VHGTAPSHHYFGGRAIKKRLRANLDTLRWGDGRFLTTRSARPENAEMDATAAVLCGVGAALVALSGASPSSMLEALLMAGAFYGVYRATRAPLALALAAAPALSWSEGAAWRAAPRAFLEFAREHSSLRATSSWVVAAAMAGALATSVALARRRIGWGLASLTVGALAFAFLARSSALLSPADSTPGAILAWTASGWESVAHRLTAVCWLVLGLSAQPVPPLPRRAGAVLGGVGAALLAALIASTPRSALVGFGPILLVVAVFAVAWILSSVGLGALARVGVSAGWIGVGLAILQIPLTGVAIAVFPAESVGDIVRMSTLFGFFGIGMTLLWAKALPLREVRALAASLFGVAFLGGLFAWVLLWVGAKHLLRVEDPAWVVEVLVQPAASVALVVFGSYLVFLAGPPEPLEAKSWAAARST